MGFAAKLRRKIRRIIYKENANGEDLISYLRDHGAIIGENVRIYAANRTFIDKSAPWLLTIGNNVRISEGVKILTHDYAWSVLKCYAKDEIEPGQVLGAESAVEIGSNVFIGMNAIVTSGVTVGDNVVIGAGSVVTKDCEPDSIYAGNPAQRIMSTKDFFYKRKKLQFEEAKKLAIRYRERFEKEPPQEVFREYFMLFTDADAAARNTHFRVQMETSGNYEQSVAYMNSHKPIFSSYKEFLSACFREGKKD